MASIRLSPNPDGADSTYPVGGTATSRNTNTPSRTKCAAAGVMCFETLQFSDRHGLAKSFGYFCTVAEKFQRFFATQFKRSFRGGSLRNFFSGCQPYRSRSMMRALTRNCLAQRSSMRAMASRLAGGQSAARASSFSSSVTREPFLFFITPSILPGVVGQKLSNVKLRSDRVNNGE